MSKITDLYKEFDNLYPDHFDFYTFEKPPTWGDFQRLHDSVFSFTGLGIWKYKGLTIYSRRKFTMLGKVIRTSYLHIWKPIIGTPDYGHYKETKEGTFDFMGWTKKPNP